MTCTGNVYSNVATDIIVDIENTLITKYFVPACLPRQLCMLSLMISTYDSDYE